MRLIDANALFLTDMEIIMCNGNYKEAWKMLLDKIDNAPTIEPVKNKLQRAVDGKTEEEMYDFLDWLMHKYANQYTDSRSAVIKWLKEDDAERKHGKENK